MLIIAVTNMSTLEKDNLIVPRTRIDLAKDFIGVAVRVGAKAPNLSSPESFKEAMLAAKSVSYVNPKTGSPSGRYMAGLFQKMGIAGEMSKKTVFRDQLKLRTLWQRKTRRSASHSRAKWSQTVA